jgi:hypothetical protein
LLPPLPPPPPFQTARLATAASTKAAAEKASQERAAAQKKASEKKEQEMLKDLAAKRSRANPDAPIDIEKAAKNLEVFMSS